MRFFLTILLVTSCCSVQAQFETKLTTAATSCRSVKSIFHTVFIFPAQNCYLTICGVLFDWICSELLFRKGFFSHFWWFQLCFTMNSKWNLKKFLSFLLFSRYLNFFLPQFTVTDTSNEAIYVCRRCVTAPRFTFHLYELEQSSRYWNKKFTDFIELRKVIMTRAFLSVDEIIFWPYLPYT